MMQLPYRNRQEAARVLAEALQQYARREDVLVLGLPRGGVPVAEVVAEALGAPLDLMLVRKLGVPGYEELAMGAIAAGGTQVLNEDVVQPLRIPEALIHRIAERERAELRRRDQAYRDGRPPPAVQGRVVILVDDGLATGATMRAAVAALRQQAPAAIVVAVPVAPPETIALLRPEVDEAVCPVMPRDFGGVGRWYEDFSQTTDDEVRACLHRAWQRQAAGG